MKLVPAVAAILVAASSLEAQQPPDTLPVAPADTIATTDALLAEPSADTLADSLRVRLLPEVDGREPTGFATGVWLFGREQLLALRGHSLADLLAQVPGITRLRGGDYGAPETVTAYGLAGGGVRVFWDGFEQVSLDGSVVDLSRIGLGGVESVRVERKPGELRIELASLRDAEARPTSLIEVGTGDYDTNFFRGTFVHPRVAGGSLGLTLDRVDTNGPNDEDGARTGGWLRFTRHRGDDIALSAEVRRMNSSAEITGYPGKASRTDWIVRGRWRPAAGLAVQAYTGRSILEGLDRDGRLPVDRDRRQHGVVADFLRGAVRASGALRLFGGNDVPSTSVDLSVVADLPAVGGVTVGTSQELWDGASVGLVSVGAWSSPFLGLSVFGGWESGTRGVVLYPVPPEIPELPARFVPEPDPGVRFTDRKAARVGASFAWRGSGLSGALVMLETDSLPLLGLAMDENGTVVAPIERTGIELSGRTRLPFMSDGFALTGAVTLWDEPARYLPERSYHAAIVFHDVFLPSGNLELWGSLGVEGRDPMQVPLPDPDQPPDPGSLSTVPFYQSWYGFVQVRVLAVRIFVGWENFTVRRDNQDFPGRVLPLTRATYGVRWTLFD